MVSVHILCSVSFLMSFPSLPAMIFSQGLITILVLSTIQCKASWRNQSDLSLTDTDHGCPASLRLFFRAQEVNTVTEAYVPWQQYSTLVLSFSFFRHLFISCSIWLIQLDVQETGNRMIRMTGVLLFERLAERPGPHSRTLAVRESRKKRNKRTEREQGLPFYLRLLQSRITVNPYILLSGRRDMAARHKCLCRLHSPSLSSFRSDKSA